jgi:hypothetical protein
MKSFIAALLFSSLQAFRSIISAPLAFPGNMIDLKLRNKPRQQREDGDPGTDGPA